MERLPDELVNVKISTCPKCNGYFRIAVEHLIDKNSEKEFYNEIKKYKLNIKTMPLLEYRNETNKWCECK